MVKTYALRNYYNKYNAQSSKSKQPLLETKFNWKIFQIFVSVKFTTLKF